MKLAPPAHGNTERGNGGEENEGAAFAGSRHALKVGASAPRSVTDSPRGGAISRELIAGLDTASVAWQTPRNSSQHGAQ